MSRQRQSPSGLQGLILLEIVCYVLIVSSLMLSVFPHLSLLNEVATTTKLNGVKAEIQAHLDLIYTQAALEQKHEGWTKILYQQQWLDLNSGYPTAVGQTQLGKTASLPSVLDNLEMTYQISNQAVAVEITQQCHLSIWRGQPDLPYRFTAIGCP
jgi:hypothetical protein